ncbi:predicted protein [Chaetoceros tenuissimus]|uniref:Uncharacterized protein n=1 Tax=Chaetoceros tenuissimus TaxID=426638 RepID=A0AAD3CUY0_9STRA|nr:predicted protein [Chaetoceros tenuissimus]
MTSKDNDLNGRKRQYSENVSTPLVTFDQNSIDNKKKQPRLNCLTSAAIFPDDSSENANISRGDAATTKGSVAKPHQHQATNAVLQPPSTAAATCQNPYTQVISDTLSVTDNDIVTSAASIDLGQLVSALEKKNAVDNAISTPVATGQYSKATPNVATNAATVDSSELASLLEKLSKRKPTVDDDQPIRFLKKNDAAGYTQVKKIIHGLVDQGVQQPANIFRQMHPDLASRYETNSLSRGISYFVLEKNNASSEKALALQNSEQNRWELDDGLELLDEMEAVSTIEFDSKALLYKHLAQKHSTKKEWKMIKSFLHRVELEGGLESWICRQQGESAYNQGMYDNIELDLLYKGFQEFTKPEYSDWTVLQRSRKIQEIVKTRSIYQVYQKVLAANRCGGLILSKTAIDDLIAAIMAARPGELPISLDAMAALFIFDPTNEDVERLIIDQFFQRMIFETDVEDSGHMIHGCIDNIDGRNSMQKFLIANHVPRNEQYKFRRVERAEGVAMYTKQNDRNRRKWTHLPDLALNAQGRVDMHQIPQGNSMSLIWNQRSTLHTANDAANKAIVRGYWTQKTGNILHLCVKLDGEETAEFQPAPQAFPHLDRFYTSNKICIPDFILEVKFGGEDGLTNPNTEIHLIRIRGVPCRIRVW